MIKSIKPALLGLAVGDALGVPVEFQNRFERKRNPVTGMGGFGIHYQPPGTWSDDTSLTIATMASIVSMEGLDYEDIMRNFAGWYLCDDFTATDVVFDVGFATQRAIKNFIVTGLPKEMVKKLSPRLFRQIPSEVTEPALVNNNKFRYNGNGSLMRILPIIFYLVNKDLKSSDEFFDTVDRVSSLTHAHKVSCIACEMYVLIGLNLLAGQPLNVAIKGAYGYLNKTYKDNKWFKYFKRIPDLLNLPETEIRSFGFVIETLEAALWCLLTSGSYSEAVLKAVNLGHDTDTVAAVAGGLAGIIWDVPEDWIKQLAKVDYLTKLADDFDRVMEKF